MCDGREGVGGCQGLSPKQRPLLYAVEVAVTEVRREPHFFFLRLQPSPSALQAIVPCCSGTRVARKQRFSNNVVTA